MMFAVFPSRAAFDAFKAATPATDENPFTRIGEPGVESTDEHGQPLPGSRVFVAHHFTADEAEYLKSRGADVRVGAIDGPAFGTEPPNP